ncbi:MAG: hypothetical protein ACLQOO_02115 [Terriglobia bacterium]
MNSAGFFQLDPLFIGEADHHLARAAQPQLFNQFLGQEHHYRSSVYNGFDLGLPNPLAAELAALVQIEVAFVL